MANTSSSKRQSLFEQLGPPDPKQLKEEAAAEAARVQRRHAQDQLRFVQLLDENSTLPTTINSITVLNANHTRRSFLERIFDPLLSANNDRPYTLAEALQRISVATDKLKRLDIFHEPIDTVITRANKLDPNTTPTDYDVYLSVVEKSRLLLKTGTEVGNAEGAAYGQLSWRNLFGGAEMLNLYGSLGTRTRSSYQGTFEAPIASNPDYMLEVGGLKSSTLKTWASHEEGLLEAWTKLKMHTQTGHKHELTYAAAWRQVTGLGQDASRTVRNDAGDSFKSSLTHTWTRDSRDYPLLPSSGVYVKTLSELAGWGPLQGDVASFKSEIETQAALPVPIPGVQNSGISFTTGFRAGFLYPLTLYSQSAPRPSRINDRFQLGGPADVRGFRMSGLGPRDGADAVGGDVFAAGSANLLFPLPRVGANKPFRLQAFVNGGRLLALQQLQPAKDGKYDSNSVRQSFASTVAEMRRGLPTVAAGFGLVYAHPVARFELNFCLPLVVRKGEEARKGLQFGVGINLL